MTETLTETQEERLREKFLTEMGYFLYQGCHFKPVRQFTEKDGDFFEKTRRLRRDDELGMMRRIITGSRNTHIPMRGFMRHPRIRKRIFSSALRQ